MALLTPMADPAGRAGDVASFRVLVPLIWVTVRLPEKAAVW